MRFQGGVVVRAPAEQVYAFLLDPVRMGQCSASGGEVEGVEVLDADRFRVNLRVGVGFLKTRLALDVTWVERVAPSRATTRARGSGPGGAVEMTTTVELSESGELTRLDWRTEAALQGSLTLLPSGVVQGMVDRMTAEVYRCVKRRLEAARPNPGQS